MEATARLKRQGLGMGGRVCKIAKRGMNRTLSERIRNGQEWS